MTLVVIGPHAVGKSTLCQALSARLGWDYHEEIGAILAKSRPADTDASHQQLEFDEQVTRAELERDAVWGARPRIVESWHPGNLAYAAHRSAELVNTLEARLAAAVRAAPCLALILDAPDAVLAARQHEPGPLDFFLAVGRDAGRWAERLGVPVLDRLSTGTRSPELLVQTLIPKLQRCL